MRQLPTRPRDISRTACAGWEVGANDQLFNAVDYEPLLVAYHNGTAVRISDVRPRRGTPVEEPAERGIRKR